MLLRTILVVVVVVVGVAVVEDLVVVEGLVVVADVAVVDAWDVSDSDVADAAVVADAADLVVVAADSAWTEYALFNSYFLIETLLKEKRFSMIFIVVTLFFKYDKPHFFFPFDIRKNRIHKIVMMEVMMQ